MWDIRSSKTFTFGCSNFQLVCSPLFYTNFMLLLVNMFNRNISMTTFIHFFIWFLFLCCISEKKTHYVQNHVWHPVCYQRLTDEYSSAVCGQLCFVGIFHWWTLSGIHRRTSLNMGPYWGNVFKRSNVVRYRLMLALMH